MVPKAEKVLTGIDEASDDACRPMRADALRNRARVLEAAEIVFACEGISVPVDVIAEKAGVGVGTLYRHFPTKEKLFEAILFERLAALTSEACSRLSSGDPGAAFFGFLEHVVAESSLKRDLIMALTGAGVELDSGDFKKDLEAAVGDLLRAAQEAGAVRLDVTPEVVLSLVGATCMANGTGHQKADPLEMLAIVCDGLRAPS